MKAKGYSLWLMPTGEAYNKFANLIRRLAEENSAPVFEPHVTLLGDLPQSEEVVLEKVQQLVSGQKPFLITLRTIDYQDYYFRTLFVKADITEPLLVLHNRAKELFNMQNIPPYMPHLSLLYGNFPQSLKEEIIKKIGRDFTTEFEVKNIHLFKADGEVSTWHSVKESPLQ